MKIVIVGGVAGGASAAARARRLDENAEIILLQAGPDVSFASCGMPYYIGGEIKNRNKMAVQTPESLNNRLNLDVRVNTRVTNIDTEQQEVKAQRADTGETYQVTYDHLILAVGAAPVKPPIPGIDRPGLYALRNLQDMDHIVDWINHMAIMPAEDMHCVVAGAGFVGLEMVEQLVRRNMNVTLVEMQPQILGPLDEEMAAILENDLKNRGVEVVTGDGIHEFLPFDKDRESSIVVLKSGRKLPPAQLTILGLGVRPDTVVAQEAGIECTRRGHVVVDDHLHTSAKNVWAIGDAVEVKNPILPGERWAVPLAGPANRQGRMVADNILGKTMRSFKGTYSVSVVRSFQQYAACVGLNEKLLAVKNIPYSCVHIHPSSHAGYYPGAKKVHLKLIFDPCSGKIFGAQAVGEDGIEKRIDVIATAMRGNMTVQDLADLELCYAPPVGSAKDPVNYAGMAAQNIVEGLVSRMEWNKLEEAAHRSDTVIVDVRGKDEIASSGPIAQGAVNIPLNELRGRLHEVPRDKHVIVTCASGQRSYYAYRILAQNGFEHLENFDGGFVSFHAIHPGAA